MRNFLDVFIGKIHREIGTGISTVIFGGISEEILVELPEKF